MVQLLTASNIVPIIIYMLKEGVIRALSGKWMNVPVMRLCMILEAMLKINILIYYRIGIMMDTWKFINAVHFLAVFTGKESIRKYKYVVSNHTTYYQKGEL